MASGILYEPLRLVREMGTSAELHIADLYLQKKRYAFDEFARLCTATSHADAVEVTCLSDLLRLFLLTASYKPKKGEEGFSKVGMRNAISFLLGDLVLSLREISQIEDDEQRARRRNLVFSRVLAILYAQYLTSNDSALQPSDNRYKVGADVIRVPRPSKLAREITAVMDPVIPLERLSMDRLEGPAGLEPNLYAAMADALEEYIRTDAQKQEGLTLFPVVDLISRNYQSTFQSIRKTVSRFFYRFPTSKVSNRFILSDAVQAGIGRTDNLVQIFGAYEPLTEYPKDLLETYSIMLSNALAAYGQSLALTASERADPTRMREIEEPIHAFVKKLLRGEFTKRALQQQSTYKDDIVGQETVTSRLSEEIRDKRKWLVCDVTIKHRTGAGDSSSAPLHTTKAQVIFVRVNDYVDFLLPSVMAPFFPEWEFQTQSFAVHASRQMMQTEGDSFGADERLLKMYSEIAAHRIAEMHPQEFTAADVRARLQKQADAIYGDDGNDYSQRAGRIAFQTDSFYFHMINKYRHGRLSSAAAAQDWMGFVVFDDSEAGYLMNPASKHRAYTIYNNPNLYGDMLKRGASRKEAQAHLSRLEMERFNAGVLREFIVAKAASVLFDTKRDKVKRIWLASVPDDFTSLKEFELTESPRAKWYQGWLTGLRKMMVGDESVHKRVEMSEDDVKVIGTQAQRVAMAKHVSITTLTELSERKIGQRGVTLTDSFHREYVFNHTRSMSPAEVNEYLRFLTRPAPRPSAAAAAAAEASGPSTSTLDKSPPASPIKPIKPSS